MLSNIKCHIHPFIATRHLPQNKLIHCHGVSNSLKLNLG